MIYDPAVVTAPHTIGKLAGLLTAAEQTARVLVVDDDVANLRLLSLILRRAGFSNVQVRNSAEGLLDAIGAFAPDVILLDLHMPGVDGVDLITDIAEYAGPREFLPVLVLTGDSSVDARDAALAAGAKDFLTKPYEPTEVILRVRNLVETRLLHVERTAELEAAKLELLEVLARASDFRDEVTHAHTRRVGELSARIAQRLGLPQDMVDQLRIAARLHDIGKLGLSDTILQKNSRLDDAEFRAQERHTIIGADILSGSRFPTLRLAEEVALSHHESWDGSGYPRRLAGDNIPLSGRIVSVADVFDALTHARPYKKPWTTDAALVEIVAERGRKFDPAVVDAFLEIVNDYISDDRLESSKSEVNCETVIPDTNSDRVRLVRDILRSGVLR